MVAASMVAVPAWAAPEDPDPTVPTTAPSTVTTAPPTTAVPTTSLPPATTAPPLTAPPGPGATTTTLPGDSTTITTLPPDATLPAEGSGGGSWIQPVIPDIESDPVFHAARLVDAATVDAQKAAEAIGGAKRTDQLSARRKARAEEHLEEATAVASAADAEVARAHGDVQNAALRSYMGYGGDGSTNAAAVADANDPGAVTRTYLTVTAAEARQRLEVGRKRQVVAQSALDVARDDARTARQARADASRALGQARTEIATTQRRLVETRRELLAAIAAAPDFGPGALELLPTMAAAGATTVPSPVGLIVLAPETDPRTAYALSFVVAQLGKPYVWGATGPGTYDCSGLMLRAWAAVGVGVPRVSQAQQASITPVAPADARPGDLVFFGTPAYHVGMYIGGGLMINAPYTGAFVRVDRVWSTVSSFGRVLPDVPSPSAAP
jgi:cell wall-associated NlpC family hydrolase